jgi:hypothetical protein
MLITCSPPSGATISDITSNGITWTLSAPIATTSVGQFISGDYWIIGPVTISSVSPGWDGTTSGSMVNPVASSNKQGYDNRAAMNFAYDATLRKTFPLALAVGDSLISTVGKTGTLTGGGATHIADAAVLTCVASDPGADAFRPPYVGTTKTIWTGSTAGSAGSDVDYTKLPGLAVPSGCTVIDTSSTSHWLNKVWLHHGTLQTDHSQIFPSNHGDSTGYPANNMIRLARMAVMACADTAQAVSCANRLIQYGIDMQACMAGNTDTWARQFYSLS